VLKQLTRASYERLAFHLADSATYARFCRIALSSSAPRRSSLQENVQRVKPETWEAVNRVLLRHAVKLGVDDGSKVRGDCTVVDAAIHRPSDSTLLWDCVRVLVRLMKYALAHVDFEMRDHLRSAKRRMLSIGQARSKDARRPLYRDLLRVTDQTATYARGALEALRARSRRLRSDRRRRPLLKLATKLESYLELTAHVLEQARRRVIVGQSVPADEKVLSIFQPQVDLIVKDRIDSRFGHKVALSVGASGLVFDFKILDGNPNDATLAVPMIERVRDVLGKSPTQAVFDGGFTSRANLEKIKTMNVRDVVFTSRRGIPLEEMTDSRASFESLRKFRAGVEGVISILKRGFGLDRCTFRGHISFATYCLGSVLAHNLWLIARTTD
jgi:IS5 family transposase